MTEATILFGTNSMWWRLKLAWMVLTCDAGIRIHDVEVVQESNP